MLNTNCFKRYAISYSIRLNLLHDSHYSMQSIMENVLRKSRQILRSFTTKNIKFSSDVTTRQGHLKTQNLTFRNSSLFLYRPGCIRKVTSKWVKNSIAGYWSKELAGRFLSKRKAPLLCFVGFALAKKSSLLTEEEEKCEGLAYLIRDSFADVHNSTITKPTQHCELTKDISLKNLKFDKMIAKGCNAAVYNAWLDCPVESADNHHIKEREQKEIMKETEGVSQAKIIISHSEGEQFLKHENKNVCKLNKPQKFDLHNVAVKVMFNYCAESIAYVVYNAMYKETLPAMNKPTFDILNAKQKRKVLKRHPNIVEMYCAFSDQFPHLSDAYQEFPSALPKRLLPEGLGKNMTLFLVLKRYHCNLKEFLKSANLSPRTSLLLFTQLLEGLVHLLQSDVAHRDLKSDNLLLDLSQGTDLPKLVITDFGCCHVSLHLDYQHYDISKGGNLALMAPEVIQADVGVFSSIDYSRSDLWTAGTIAYEMYGSTNPFYSSSSNLKSDSYLESDLPPFPTHAPKAIQKLVLDILKKNNKLRPSQSFAANVCQLLLYAPQKLLCDSYNENTCKRLLDWINLMSAETFLEATLSDDRITPLEFELRRTFCTRIQFSEVLQALKYIMEI